MSHAADGAGWNAVPAHPAASDVLRIRIAFALAAAAVVAAGLMADAGSLLKDPDNWWHVRVGLDILANHALPTTDAYSHTFAGKPWIAKEWLAQVMLALAYGSGGWNGVALLTVAAIALAVFLMAWHLGASLKPIVAVGLTLIMAIVIAPLYNARPFILTLPIIVVWTATLFDAAREERAPPFWLLPLMILWANLHAAFTLGFAIAFIAGLDVLARTRFTQPRLLARWIGFGLLCPLVCLVHPYDAQAMLATLSVAHGNEAVGMILEWQPFDASKSYLQEVGLLLGIFALSVSRVRVGWPKGLFFVFALHLFLTHVRFMYMPVLIPLLIGKDVATQYPALSARNWALGHRDGLERLFAERFPLVLGGGVVLCVLAVRLFMTTAAVAPGNETSAEGGIAYARAHGLSGNVLNSYQFGGTLIFHGIKTFIDGRTDQLFLDGFMRRDDRSGTSAGKPILIEQLKKHAIGWALLSANDPRIPFFNELPGWRRVYADDAAVIYAPL